MCCRVCHFHFFWVGMTLGPERTMQTIFCGIFCRKLSFEYFTFLQKVASAIYKKSDTFQFCMQLRLVYLRTNVKEATFSGALMRAFCALNRQRIQVSSCLSVIFQNQQWLSDSSLLKHECAQRSRQLTHFCEVHASLTFLLLQWFSE